MLLVAWLMAVEIVPATTPHDYELRVVTDPGRLPAGAKGKQVWLRDILVDGRPAAATVARAGAWRDGATGERWEIVNEHPTEGDRLAWRAVTFSMTALMHPWSGAVELRRDGVPCGFWTLTSEGTAEVQCSAPPMRSWSSLLLALLAGAVVFALVMPWRGGARLTAWLALLTSSVHGLVWLITPVGVTTDTPYYLIGFHQTLQGEPSGFPPGYGVFLWLAGLSGGPVGVVAAFVQHALMVVVAVMLHRTFRGLVGEAPAFVGALIGAVLFPNVFGAQAMMTETLTCFLLLIVVIAVIDKGESRSVGSLLVCGLLAGWAALTRMVPLAASVPLLFWRHMWPWPRRSWKWALCATGIALMPVVGMIVQNGLRSGQWQLSTKLGRHLYNHFVYQQKLLDEDGPATKEFRSHLNGRDPRDLFHWDAGLLVPGSNEAEWRSRERLFLRVALEAASTVGLVEHVRFSLALTWSNLIGDAVPTMVVGDEGRGIQPNLAHPATLSDPWRAVQLRLRTATVYRAVWPAACWLGLLVLLVAAWRKHGRTAWLACGWTVFAYMFASSAIEYELPRYQAALTPLVVMMAVGGIHGLWELAVAMLRRKSPAQ